MPRIEVKEEAKEEKKGQSGAWEKKKVPMPQIEEKEEAKEEKKRRERGMGEEKSSPCPES